MSCRIWDPPCNFRPRYRRYADPPLILKSMMHTLFKTEEFRPTVRLNGSDAASKLQLKIFRCPFFGVVVGGLPGRVFKNSFYIFSLPRHALKPLLICLLLR